VLTEYVREQRKALEDQVSSVVRIAEETNKKGHEPLVADLFPAPAQEQSLQVRMIELAEALIGREGRPSVYQALLDSINAGGPEDPAGLGTILADEKALQIEKHKAENGETPMTREQEAEMNARLTELRIGRYQQRADEISVYATTACLPSSVPAAVPSELLPAARLFEWQWDYWFIADLFAAVGEANRGEDGSLLPVERSVVKRIQSIRLEPPPIYVGETLASMPEDPNPGAPNYSRSITGRRSSKSNKIYDVRTADLTLVVSSARLPELINAISRTNFMSVIGLTLSEVDPWAELAQGFYYGPEHVVRAEVKVESVWLRSWVAPLMPDDFKALMAVVEPSEPEAPAAPPPPSPGRARPAADEDDDMSIRRGRSADDDGDR
jgi:hypothetical protein